MGLFIALYYLEKVEDREQDRHHYPCRGESESGGWLVPQDGGGQGPKAGDKRIFRICDMVKRQETDGISRQVTDWDQRQEQDGISGKMTDGIPGQVKGSTGQRTDGR